MTVYVPVLKAKHGEFEAFGALDPDVAAKTTAVFEFCPADDVAAGLQGAVQKAIRYLPPGSRIAVDTNQFNQLATIPALQSKTIPQWVAERLQAAGHSTMPVTTLDDPVTQRQLGDLAQAGAGRAIVRVDANFATAASLPAQLADAQANLGLPAHRVHVLLDFKAVRSATALTTAEALALQLLPAAGVGGWASLTVAAGAFPASISGMPTGGEPTPIARFDADLWRRLTAAGHFINFGDYGVNGPENPSGGRGPLPNLRYTNERHWLAWREPKNRPGNESFYDLAQRVVAHGTWAGAAFSWGDAQVELASREARGPGTATQWRAYGTSHHITTVVDRLATLGEP